MSEPDQQNAKLELVVVGFTGELRALKLQARSLRLFAAPGMFERIIYICNDNAFRPFKNFIETEVKPELGPLAQLVEVVAYERVLGKRIEKTGWRSQQALKLLVAQMVQTPQFLILDSKNHFIRPFNTGTFITPEGKLRVNPVPINPLFRAHFESACHYFGVESSHNIDTAHPMTTPFIMATNIARKLIASVEGREKTSFFDMFIRDTSLNEFFFYYAYLIADKKLSDATYEERSRYAVGFFGQAAKSYDRVLMLIKALDEQDICCTGVHRFIFEAAHPESLTAITAMWRRFGLIETEAEAAYFQTCDKPMKRKRFILF